MPAVRVAPLALTLALALASSARADDAEAPPTRDRTALGAALAARGEAVSRTLAVLDDKRAAQRAVTAARLRALYKLTRAGQAPLWFERAARSSLARRRGAVRVVRRDLGELALLDGELDAARAARGRIAAMRALTEPTPPARGSLARPVAGALVARFGDYRSGRLALTRRGVELAARTGEVVHAPAAGRVTYVGPLRGRGEAIVIDHGGFTSVLTRLVAPAVTAGMAIARDQAVGLATGPIGLEIRLAAGDPAGFPIDPAPLLAP